jgi:NAD(P)-dependent dehydrogenase (short-subunit alcohol dehydrogenase family)
MVRILVTGASDGLGRALAESLAADGHELIVHGRDPDRLAAVSRKTGAVPLRADLSRPSEVRALADAVSERYDRLDVLVNNAAVGFGAPGAPRTMTEDGIELRLAVNYLAPFLLSRRLLPLLRRPPAARIVNVASIGQLDIDLDDLMMDRGYDGISAYRRAKLALIADTFELAEELKDTGITVNALHPATLMPTTMVHEARTGTRQSLEYGLVNTLKLIVDPALETTTGRYFQDGREARARDQAYDPDFRTRLRAEAEALVGKATLPPVAPGD